MIYHQFKKQSSKKNQIKKSQKIIKIYVEIITYKYATFISQQKIGMQNKKWELVIAKV